jgi:hypothetical protein
MIPELPERARLDLVKTSEEKRETRERAPAFYFYSHFFLVVAEIEGEKDIIIR